MKHVLPPLDSLKAFEASARHLSFSRAAKELCVSKSAISYQIRKLEEHLACRLFKRSVRQIYLTHAGQMLLQSTQTAFTELSVCMQKVGSSYEPHGVLVGATTYVAMRCLSPIISSFSVCYPNVSVTFQHQVNEADFRLSHVDIALRWGACSGQLDQQRLVELPMPMFAAVSPSLLERVGIDPERNVDSQLLLNAPLNSITLLCEDRPLDMWQEWFGGDALLANPRRVINDANVRVQAAIDGQGFILADQMMSAELANGLLVVAFEKKLIGYGYELLCSPSHANPDATALSDWLLEALP